jgi:hypothetical protein
VLLVVAVVEVGAKGDRVSRAHAPHPVTPIDGAGGIEYLPGMVGILVGLGPSGNSSIRHEGKEDLRDLHVGNGMFVFGIIESR